MNVTEHNQTAWNNEVAKGNEWTLEVSEKEINLAKAGKINIVLTPGKKIPQEWLGNIKRKKILCLASGGGQQGPLLAAAGARVTVFDNSDKQLEKDQLLSDQYHLNIETVRGNMQNLTSFKNNTFDMIIHPVSNCFVENILPVWQEAYRVLKKGGLLLAGFMNPLIYALN